LISGVGVARADAPLANTRVLWLGDSITHQAAYVTFVEYFLEKTYPADKFDFIEIGRPSETTSGLSEKTHPGPRPCVFSRLQRALDLVKPQIVFACYGMNDGIYHPQSPDRMQAFENGIQKLIAACHADAPKVILLSPPPFDKMPVGSIQKIDAPDFSFRIPYEGYDSVLTDYTKWEQTLPKSEVLAIDLHTPMFDYIQQQRETNPKFSFVTDGIHPDPLGHLLIAETILQALHVPLPGIDSDLNHELAKVLADPLYTLIAAQHRERSDAWFNNVLSPTDTPDLSAKVAKAESDVVAQQTQIDKLRALPTP
jgi:lysophospholipase L1-like esterase